jgi:hypothetical protein
MVGGIFISCRREDSQHAAGRLVDRLTQSFGRERIFMDVDAVESGLDFLDVINARVAESFVFLVVIGAGWANAADPDGRRRLDNPVAMKKCRQQRFSREIRVRTDRWVCGRRAECAGSQLHRLARHRRRDRGGGRPA